MNGVNSNLISRSFWKHPSPLVIGNQPFKNSEVSLSEYQEFKLFITENKRIVFKCPVSGVYMQPYYDAEPFLRITGSGISTYNLNPFYNDETGYCSFYGLNDERVIYNKEKDRYEFDLGLPYISGFAFPPYFYNDPCNVQEPRRTSTVSGWVPTLYNSEYYKRMYFKINGLGNFNIYNEDDTLNGTGRLDYYSTPYYRTDLVKDISYELNLSEDEVAGVYQRSSYQDALGSWVIGNNNLYFTGINDWRSELIKEGNFTSSLIGYSLTDKKYIYYVEHSPDENFPSYSLYIVDNKPLRANKKYYICNIATNNFYLFRSDISLNGSIRSSLEFKFKDLENDEEKEDISLKVVGLCQENRLKENNQNIYIAEWIAPVLPLKED